MTTAVLKCEAKNGLIGHDFDADINKINKFMKINVSLDVWIGINVSDLMGEWKFLDNKPVENPAKYFKTEIGPLACGTVHLGHAYFDDRTCFKPGYYALCQNCSSQKCKYFRSPKPTRNWFHAREICLKLWSSLAVLKRKADIPEIPEPTAKMLWIGVYSLKDKVVLQGNVSNILANITLKGVDDVPALVKGESCLIAENAENLRVVPCSQNHSFICRGKKDRSSGRGHNITPSNLIGVLWVMQIGNIIMTRNHL